MLTRTCTRALAGPPCVEVVVGSGAVEAGVETEGEGGSEAGEVEGADTR